MSGGCLVQTPFSKQYLHFKMDILRVFKSHSDHFNAGFVFCKLIM